MDDNTFLTEIQQEGKIPSEENQEKENAPASSTENNQDGKPASSAEGEKKDDSQPKPDANPAVFQAFHEHPRWKALQEELKDLRAFREEAQTSLEELKTLKSQAPKEEKAIPAWFVATYGDNKDLWTQYNEYTAQERAQIREEIISELSEVEEKQSKEEQEEIKKGDQWITDELTRLDEYITANKLPGYHKEGEIEGKKTDIGLNELLKVAKDYLPTDNEGNISLQKAYEIWRVMKPAESKSNADDKKKVADQTMQKGKPESGAKDYLTAHDLRGKSIRDLVSE